MTRARCVRGVGSVSVLFTQKNRFENARWFEHRVVHGRSPGAMLLAFVVVVVERAANTCRLVTVADTGTPRWQDRQCHATTRERDDAFFRCTLIAAGRLTKSP